jgi:Kef-type K+ transport system membrane component KefB
MLETLVALLGATAIAVPISRRLGFGSILGYLSAGVIIGPSGLRLVTNVRAAVPALARVSPRVTP